ncbi:uncharacterized protein LOC118638859 [Molossus molossus]|uniref:uncharacterized protein LOC118638859 n=1 Tax=Molossus molossus TaxID=27622 RepID=UPI0017469BCE|nr:uncharacterized protein LOC118638859 [Molossus molossus]
MDSSITLDLLDPDYFWEEDRKFILRGWSLVFSILATLMTFSIVDGRMVYLTGSYTGYVGLWTNCRRHQCPSFGEVTVLIHMSMGFMMLALLLYVILLPVMGLSFRPVFRRLSKTDLVFSVLSLSTGLLIILSMTLFVVNLRMLHPRPQISYLVTTYLCWGAGVLMNPELLKPRRPVEPRVGVLASADELSPEGHAAQLPGAHEQTAIRRKSQAKDEPARFTPARGDPRPASLSTCFSDTAGLAPLTVVTRKSDLG